MGAVELAPDGSRFAAAGGSVSPAATRRAAIPDSIRAVPSRMRARAACIPAQSSTSAAPATRSNPSAMIAVPSGAHVSGAMAFPGRSTSNGEPPLRRTRTTFVGEADESTTAAA